jgi:RHS repeat-associated protein
MFSRLMRGGAYLDFEMWFMPTTQRSTGMTLTSACAFSVASETWANSTGKERDAESGNDYFGARYYASSMGRWMSPDPSNLGVDFFLPQTWNRYGYALNNPLTMLDRNGFWPTWVHNDIIDKSFPTLSSGQRDILKNQSAAVDEDQSVAGSYKHGMVGEGCDGCFDAQGDAKKTADWISQNEHDAGELQQQWIDSGHTGLCPAALQAFGNALHTITDMTSPSHEGGQHWRDNYGDLRTYWHVLREIVPTDSNKRRQQTAIQNAQRAFWQVFGSGCHTEQTTTTIYDSNGNSIGGSVSTHTVCN